MVIMNNDHVLNAIKIVNYVTDLQKKTAQNVIKIQIDSQINVFVIMVILILEKRFVQHVLIDVKLAKKLQVIAYLYSQVVNALSFIVNVNLKEILRKFVSMNLK